MKFTFKKHKIKILVIDLIIITLFIGIFYIFNSIDSFVAYFILVILSILIFKMLYHYFLIKKFFKKHSKEKIKEFEEELSNVLINYNNNLLTENYIFSLETFNYVNYQDIICIDSSVGIINHNGDLFTPGRKTVLHLKDNKKFIIKTPMALFINSYYSFIKLIKKKNSDIFIGNINDYENEKDNIEKIKKIKIRTKV